MTDHPTGARAIAQCCRTSARMLEIADEEIPDAKKRVRIQNLNRQQAKLLRFAADMAEELADEIDLHRAAVKKATQQ